VQNRDYSYNYGVIKELKLQLKFDKDKKNIFARINSWDYNKIF